MSYNNNFYENNDNSKIIFRSETSESNNIPNNFINELLLSKNKNKKIDSDLFISETDESDESQGSGFIKEFSKLTGYQNSNNNIQDNKSSLLFSFFNNTNNKNEENDGMYNNESDNNYENDNNYEDNKLETLYEDFYEEDSFSENSSVIDDREKYLFNKYFIKNNEKNIEIKIMNENKNKDSELLRLVSQNNYQDIKKYFKNGNTMFKSLKMKENSVVIKSLCVKNNCISCNKCYETPVYFSLKNTNRGIKTIYNYLLKLLIVKKQFRTLCDCCKNSNTVILLDRMSELYNEKKYNKILQIGKSYSPKQKIELEINFYINQFMKIVTFLDCSCKYSNYKKCYYNEKFLNFSCYNEIYLTTIPNLIKLLKQYYSLNENNEELYLMNDNRCIHEDVQYYGTLKYCTKKESKNIDIRYEHELVMKIDNVHTWIIKSIQNSILLLNEQSLELFNYELIGNYRIGNDYRRVFDNLYKQSNIFLDLDYKLNGEGIIKTILKSKLNNKKMIEIVKKFIEQYKIRNRKKRSNFSSFENVMINYTKESIESENYIISSEFIRQIINFNNIEKTEELNRVLSYIFDKIIATPKLTVNDKISFLKVINKNKINVCEYDFVSNLIDYNSGDEIILGFDKISNNMFKINDYNSEIYIKDIIKKCIINIKINILDYVLYGLKDKIIYFKINPINIYLTNIKKKTILEGIKKTHEYKYIKLLDIILKYENIIDEKKTRHEKYYEAINYCIENNLIKSSKMFINSGFIKKEKNLLIECIIKNDHITFEAILLNYPYLLKENYDNYNILNLLFKRYIPEEENVLVRFIKKILSTIIYKKININLLNYDDDYNESFGFLLLSCENISKKNKIYLINLSKYLIDPMKINEYYDKELCKINTKNIPLILYSYLMEESEICYILLNQLILGEKLDRIKKDSSCLFNSYCKNDKVNINIIPIIIKYLRDKQSNYDYDFDENKVSDMLEMDYKIFTIMLICMKMVCTYSKIIYENNKNIEEVLTKNNRYTESSENYNSNKNIFNFINIMKNKKLSKELNKNEYDEIYIKGKNNALINTDSCRQNNNYDSDDSFIEENEVIF